MRNKLLLSGLISLLCSSGCSDTSLVVDVGNIPPIATELRAIVRMSDKQSADLPRFSFPAGRSTYSFGLNLKEKQTGPAQITVATFLNNCLLSSGKVDIPDIATAGQEVGVNLDAMAADVSADSCPDSKPVLTWVETSQNPATGGIRLTFSGFGFTPTAQVLLDHSTTPASGYVSPNPLEFSVELPRLVPPINHPLHVQVLQPDGGSAVGDFTVSIPVFDGDAPPIFPQSASDPFRLLGPIWAEDLDGDKHVDIIMSSQTTSSDSGYITVYFNDGKGNFTAGNNIPLNADIRDVAAAKLRSGNYRDIVATICHSPTNGNRYSRCSLTVIQQLSARRFTNTISSNPNLNFGNGDGAENNGQHAFLTVGDFNQDGISDVAAVTNAAQAPYQLTSTTGLGSMLKLYDGTAMTKDGFKYSAAKTLPQVAGGIASASFVSASPTQLDLVISEFATNGNGMMEVYPNPGNGRFDQATATQLSTVGRPGKIAAKDFDGDGRTDFAVTLFQNNQMQPGSQVNIYLRRTGSWSAQTISTQLSPFALVGIDLLWDSVSDLIVSNSRSGSQSAQLGFLFNQGAGAFAPMNQTTLPLPSTSDAYLMAADFNEDAKQDLAVSTVGVSGNAGVHVGTLSILYGL